MYKSFVSTTTEHKEDPNKVYPDVPHLKAKPIVDCRNILGECVLWDDEKISLLIDNLGKFWTLDPETKETNTYELPDRPDHLFL